MNLSKCFGIVTLVLFGFGGRAGAEPSLTIYNQNFAVVREALALALQRGTNQVSGEGARQNCGKAGVRRDADSEQRLALPCHLDRRPKSLP